MPRDSSGNYTLPVGNPVASDTIISISWANPTMSDLGNEITGSLSRNGEGGMLAPLRLVNGTQAAPGLAFNLDVQTGMRLNAPGEIYFSLSAQNAMRMIAPNTVQLFDGANWFDILSQAPNAGLIFGDAPTLLNTNCALNVGMATDPDTEPHIEMGATLMQAKSDATTATQLNLNALGGNVQIGDIGSGAGLLITTRVDIYHDGTLSARSTDPGDGGLLLNNTFTGVGLERALTESDLVKNVLWAIGPEPNLTDTDNAFNAGANPGGGPHVAIGQSIIQAKADPTTEADLNINPLGGNVFIKDTMRTTTPANGGLEVNNQDTGSGFERVLTTSDAPSSNNQFTQKASDQIIPANGTSFTTDNTLTATVEAGKVYEFLLAAQIDNPSNYGLRLLIAAPACQLMMGQIVCQRPTETLGDQRYRCQTGTSGDLEINFTDLDMKQSDGTLEARGTIIPTANGSVTIGWDTNTITGVGNITVREDSAFSVVEKSV